MQWACCKIHYNYLAILVLLLEDVSQTHAAFWFNCNASLPNQVLTIEQKHKTNKNLARLTLNGIVYYTEE